MSETTLQIKVKDVFSFRYNEAETKKRFEPYHCFDGTLIVRQRENGELYLEDTYWGGFQSRTFTLKEALKQGHLTFICNLDEVIETTGNNSNYYNDSDFISLYIHHGYRNQYYIKKGAVRSKERMLAVCKEKIKDQESEIRVAMNRIEWLRKDLELIEHGELDNVYL